MSGEEFKLQRSERAESSSERIDLVPLREVTSKLREANTPELLHAAVLENRDAWLNLVKNITTPGSTVRKSTKEYIGVNIARTTNVTVAFFNNLNDEARQRDCANELAYVNGILLGE